jgi:predicted RNA-binding protein with PUA-like domain
MNHWLLKSEPDTFGIDALAAAPRKTTAWNGVRNYQARNMLRDSIKKGDQAFFYHSGCEVPGIAGIVEIVRGAYPDPTAFDPKSEYFDAASKRDAPRWFVVDVKLVREFGRLIALDELRKYQAAELANLVVLRRGNRLSVTPVAAKEWDFILSLE